MHVIHQGGDAHEVHLIIYRDCGPDNINGTGFDNTIQLGVYEGSELIQSVSVSLDLNDVSALDLDSGNPCGILPDAICLERAEYIAIVNLPPSESTYTITHERCCRSPQIVNLLGPADTGFTMFAEVLNPPAVEKGEGLASSTPRFLGTPQAYVCLGQPFELPNEAMDAEQDSLHYQLYTVHLGGDALNPAPMPSLAPPLPSVSWANGYAPDAPFGMGTDVAIDPASGMLTGTPLQTGKYVVGILVTAYRQEEDGEWMTIGRILRDYTIDVVTCDIIAPEVLWPDPCSGLELTFGATAEGANFLWDFGTGEPPVESPSGSLSHLFPEEGEYVVQLEYDWGGCGGAMTQQVEVTPEWTPAFQIPPIGCITDENWALPVQCLDSLPSSHELHWLVDGSPQGAGQLIDSLSMDAGLHEVSASITTTFGCVFASSQTVDVPELATPVDIIMPNVFTPNGDGKNDRLIPGVRSVTAPADAPLSPHAFQRLSLTIFNRWGTLVYEADGPGTGWDGQVGGEPASEGTYYCIVNADLRCPDQSATLNTEVTLKRR